MLSRFHLIPETRRQEDKQWRDRQPPWGHPPRPTPS